jgi:nucleoside-triphosphatase THEP1
VLAAGAGACDGPAEGERIGLEAEALPGRERWLLARTDRRLGGPSCGPFSFSRAGIERAVRHLRDCRASGAVLLIVDEVGPLELDRRLGFYPFLETLRHPAGQTVLLVVRPALVAAAGRLAGSWAAARVVAVTPANRDELPRRILDALP